MSIPPHDLETERALLGGIFSGRYDQRALALDSLVPGDFYGDFHRSVFVAFGSIHRRGDHPDDISVLRTELVRSGWEVDMVALSEITRAGTGRNLASYIETLDRYSTARKVLSGALEVAEVARKAVDGPAELVDFARETFTRIDVPTMDGPTDGLSTLDDFLELADLKPAPWVVPGLMRQGWRLIAVAPEGYGKSVAFRQIATAAAAGVHPFTHRPIPAVRTLLVDLENPNDAIAETARPIRDMARDVGSYDPQRVHLWRRPEGINLRSRSDRAAFHRVLDTVRPDLVCLGPLYKAFRKVARENDEDAAADVQAILDDTRSRYNFALLMEHHAPKGSGLSAREMVPFGSSLWLRWPELGLALVPGGDSVPKDSLLVRRWRKDRMQNQWPARLERSAGWPWSGVWDGPMPSYDESGQFQSGDKQP